MLWLLGFWILGEVKNSRKIPRARTSMATIIIKMTVFFLDMIYFVDVAVDTFKSCNFNRSGLIVLSRM